MTGGHRGIEPIVVLVLIATPILFLGLDGPAFMEDEGRYAEVAREMLLTRDWITPHLDFTVFLNKPPLAYWLTALTFTLVGTTEHARLWPALAGLGLLGVVFCLGRVIAGTRTGLLAGLVLLTSVGFFFEARVVRPDLLVTLAVSVALLSALRAYAAPATRSRTRWMCLGAGTLALSVMAKGLVGVVVAGATLGLVLLLSGRSSFLLQVRWWPALAVALAIVLPWHLCAGFRNAGFWWDYAINQHLLFFFDRKLPRDSLPASLPLFWAAFLVRTLPWGVFLPAAIRHALSRARTERTPATLVPLVWLVSVLAFFSVSPARLEHYSVPALPAVGLLVGWWWAEATEGKAGSSSGVVSAAALVAIAAGGLLLAPGLVRAQGWAFAPALPRLAVASFALLLVGATAACLCLWYGRPRIAFAALALTMVPQFASIHRGWAMVHPVYSWKALGTVLMKVLPDDGEVVFAASDEYQACGGLIFYSGTPLTILLPPGYVPPPYLDTDDRKTFITQPEFLRRWNGDRPILFVADPDRGEADLVPPSSLLLGQWGNQRLRANRAFAERYRASLRAIAPSAAWQPG
jgi:4-amino-4-deoxy-L-arabinose transferase-like glycosyltransferase